MPPVVSIILPTFNRQEYLVPAIESVLAQTFEQWELIIADDGSADATRRYLQSLADPRIEVMLLEHTGKPCVISNLAIRRARGQYIAFLDSDDLWLPEKLAAQLSSLRSHPERRWSYTRFALVDSAGNAAASTRDRDRPAPAGWVLEKLLRASAVIAQPSVLVDRELLLQLNGFDEELTMCYDDDLWLRLAHCTEIDSVDAPLTLVRRHAQHSGSDAQAWRDRKRVFEKALGRNDDPRFADTLRELCAQMALGLAKSHARYGRRRDAVSSLLSCIPQCRRFPSQWFGAAFIVASRFAPGFVLSMARQWKLAHRP
jgi:glycosyltransferase involved in cell wall biosynthesis